MRLLPRSLKKQLLLYLLTPLLLVWAATGYFSYRASRAEVEELFDAELAQSARVVQAFVENMLRQKALIRLWERDKTTDLFDMPALEHKYERKIAFQLRSVKDGVLMRSDSAPEFALSLARNGYSQATIHEQLWHVFSVSSENGEYVIHVGQRDDIRRQLVETIAGQQLAGFVVALPVLAAIIWLAVSRTLVPLQRLTDRLASREALQLQTLPLDDMPIEIVPVVRQLNNLFTLLEQAFANERHFSSDASHELRTPLAGLLTQIQVAQRADQPDVRLKALNQAQQAVLRMTHLVQQLLILSRVQQSGIVVLKQPVDANVALVTAIADLDFTAHGKGVEIELACLARAQIHVNPYLFDILLRNVLENAIKYAPSGGKVEVGLHAGDCQALLTIEDNGPGVPADDYDRLGQRFYRCVATAGSVEGSGLGLSIVRRIVGLHDAGLGFSRSALGGLRVELRFDLPAAAGKNANEGSALPGNMV